MAKHVCAGILFRTSGPRYLLLHRVDRDEWEGPGGHLEEGETPAQAARREAVEEIGVHPERRLHLIDTNDQNRVRYSLHLQDVPAAFTPTLNHEHDRWGWFGPDNLPQTTHPQLARVIGDLPHELNAARWATPTPYAEDPTQFNPRTIPLYDPNIRLPTRQGGKITVDEYEELARMGFDQKAIDAARVSQEERDSLPASAFAVPGKRKLLITDATHTKLAWDMVDRTGGLSDEEREHARSRILRRAKELGLDTSEWKVKATMELMLDAMSLMVPPVQGHPNRHPFSGIVTRIGVPSDSPPGGSNGKCTILTADAVESAIPSLLGMGINYTRDLTGHDPQKKIGVITEASVQGNGLAIKGFFYAADFPDVVKDIVANRQSLGWSYELIVKPNGAQVAGDYLVVKDFVFTGAAVLRKDAAAYRTTTLAAASEDNTMAEHDHQADETVLKQIESLQTQIEELKKAQHRDMALDRQRAASAGDDDDDDDEGEDLEARRRKEKAAGRNEDYADEYVNGKRRGKKEVRAATARALHHHTQRMRKLALHIATNGEPELARELHDLADKIDAQPFGTDKPNDGEYAGDREYFYDQPLRGPSGQEPAYDDLPDIHARRGKQGPRRRSLTAGEFLRNPRTTADAPADSNIAAVARMDAELAAAGVTGPDSIKAKLAAFRRQQAA